MDRFFWKGSSKTRFQYGKNSCDDLLFFGAIQGHTGGVIGPELMGHVANPFNVKEFLFHRGCALNSNSILEPSSPVDRRAKTDDKLYSSLHWIPGEMKLKKSLKMTCQNRDKHTARLSGNILRTLSPRLSKMPGISSSKASGSSWKQERHQGGRNGRK